MKPQDIIFLFVTAVMLFMNKPRIWVGFAIVLIILSIPLFAHQVFFTAARLTWYAAAFLAITVVSESVRMRNEGGKS